MFVGPLSELVSLVKVFRMFRLERTFFGVPSVDTVGRCTISYDGRCTSSYDALVKAWPHLFLGVSGRHIMKRNLSLDCCWILWSFESACLDFCDYVRCPSPLFFMYMLLVDWCGLWNIICSFAVCDPPFCFFVLPFPLHWVLCLAKFTRVCLSS